MSISHRFVVHGLPGDYDECEPLTVELRCVVCGASQYFGENDESSYLAELVEWAEAHKCSRRLSTNSEPQPGERVITNAMIQGTAMDLDTTRINQAMEAQEQGEPFRIVDSIFGNPDWSTGSYVAPLVAEFRQRFPMVRR